MRPVPLKRPWLKVDSGGAQRRTKRKGKRIAPVAALPRNDGEKPLTIATAPAIP